ncbi:MAG: LptF/LptG family permease, partial [Bacteriovoracaceae bacterium]
ERSELKDVFINVADKKSKSTQSIFAEKGVLIKQRRSEWELPSIRMFLTNGNIITRDSEENEIQKILFKEYDFPISSNYRPSFITKDSMRSNQELIEHIHENQEKLLKMKPNNDDFKNTRKALVKSELEYYSRMNTPIQCVLFIFLGFIFGIRKSRGREKSSGPVSFLIIILYYSVFFAGMSFAKKGALPSQFVVFLPSVIAFIVASRFYKKIDWAS